MDRINFMDYNLYNPVETPANSRISWIWTWFLFEDNVSNRRTSYDPKWWLTENSNILFTYITFYFWYILDLVSIFSSDSSWYKTFSSVSWTFALPVEACLLNSIARNSLPLPPPPLLFKRPKNVATLGSCFLLVLVEVFRNPLTLKTDQHLLSP